MENIIKEYIDSRPQNLCKMCGKCCKVVTTALPYDELKKLASEGDEGAIDFLNIFNPYESLEEAKKVDASVVENIIEKQKEDNNSVAEITFYRCKFIQDDNLCGNYQDRPALCSYFPGSPWAVVPPECGFEGWLFSKREEIKYKIRKTKEDLLELELLKNKTVSPQMISKIDMVEKKMRVTIDYYQKYGSEYW